MKRIIQSLSVVSILVITCGGCAKESSTPKIEPADSTAAQTGAENQDSVTVELAGADSVTVFDLLKQTHTVDFVSTSGGVFVKGIDSVNNGTSTFWVYSVNDTTPKIAADLMYTRAGDKIVWHFRKMKEWSESR